jgi:hypothetical protein
LTRYPARRRQTKTQQLINATDSTNFNNSMSSSIRTGM